MSGNNELAPLQGLLNSVLSRLAALEGKVGIETPAGAAQPVAAQSLVSEDSDEVPERVSAYDTHVKDFVVPLCETCDKIGLDKMGSHLLAAWDGIRDVIVMGTKCKRPGNMADLTPHLKKTQDALGAIGKMRLKRDFDWHYKSIMEMVVVCSWVLCTPPKTPTSFVKEAVGSSDFWSNKIRKQYKGKDDTQIAFCDRLKKMILDLSQYVKQYHLSGLAFNPHGIPIADYTAPAKGAPAPAPSQANVLAELANKRTAAGDSAASGLRKVTKDQQTWRKEFKGDAAKPKPVQSTTPKPKTTPTQKKPKGPPKCEYLPIPHKWIVENQTKDSNPNGMLTVTVKDAKDQVYVYNCDNTTVTITGKVKTITMDKCTKCNLIFDTAISSCEIVNCSRMQLQTNGVCPSFSIDKTDGCLIYLSQETIAVSSFVTSKSSEMNVNWTDQDGEVKEAPIPEQFQHKLVNGTINTSVSDLYTH
jgi:adenylyl cyclase-associated protein